MGEFTDKLRRLGVLAEAEMLTLRSAGVYPAELLIENQAVHFSQARGDLMLFLQERFGWTDPVVAGFFGRKQDMVTAAIKKARKRARATNVVPPEKGG